MTKLIADSYKVPKENFCRCMKDFWNDKSSKHSSSQHIVDFMRGHFSSVPFYRGSFSPPQLEMSVDEFSRRMQLKAGLKLVRVLDSTNGFWDCFSLGYFGRRGDSNFFQSCRGALASYILSVWKDRPIRDILAGSHTEIVDVSLKTIDLHSYLSRLSNPSQPIILSKRPKECIEVLCTALMLGCRLSVLSLDCDDMIHCEDVGDVLSPTRVFVAFNGSEFFGFTNDLEPPTSCLSQGSLPASCSPEHAPSPQQISPQYPSWSSNSASVPQRALSTTSPQGSDEFLGWGTAPTTNSDAYLCPTWPETEALLRSLALFNGIWTDAQTLQHTNWTHRVRIVCLLYDL